jgi:hypothetical protein
VLLTAYNGFGSRATQIFTLNVPCAPSFAACGLPGVATVSTAYTFAYRIGGYPAPTLSVTAGALPAGLRLSSTGAISGAPSVSGVFTGTITASNNLGIATQNFTITVLSTYNSWSVRYPGIGGPAATPENDGVPNLLKYLFDIAPATSMSATDYAALPTAGTTTVSGTQYLTLTYRENALETGITVNVQTSPDLQTWTTLINPTITQTGTDMNTGDPIMQVSVPVTSPAEFLRLNATSP